jgi:hypothetical protein
VESPYHCPSCGEGACPADRQLGLEGRYRPAVCERVSLTGILEPFGKAEDLLLRRSGLKVTHESCRTVTETLGEQREARSAAATPSVPVRPRKRWAFPLPERDGVSFSGTVADLGLDAFSVPTLDPEGKRE